MKQADLGLNLSSKRTRKRQFLDEMERVVPWGELIALIEPHYPRGMAGRPPFGIAATSTSRERCCRVRSRSPSATPPIASSQTYLGAGRAIQHRELGPLRSQRRVHRLLSKHARMAHTREGLPRVACGCSRRSRQHRSGVFRLASMRCYFPGRIRSTRARWTGALCAGSML